MARIRIIKKNDEFTQEYEVGDIFEIAGTWYGGVHIEGKTGIPVSLDKEEYTELDTEPVIEETKDAVERDIHVGDIVRHFKREWVSEDTSEYLYKVLAFASHTETGERLVIYQGMYAPFKICARPYDMFMSEVDREKYPDVKQKYRFEKVEPGEISEIYQPKVEVPTQQPETTQILPEAEMLSGGQSTEELPEPGLLEFLDTDDWDMKYNILVSLRDKMTDKLVDDFAVALDIVIPEGPLDKRYEELKNCLRTRQKFESQRLR